MNPRQVLGQIQAELFAAHGQLCPNCGQFNAKVSQDWALIQIRYSWVYLMVNKEIHCVLFLFFSKVVNVLFVFLRIFGVVSI